MNTIKNNSITFKSYALQRRIGQWLDIISIKDGFISPSKRIKINQEFAKLLSTINISGKVFLKAQENEDTFTCIVNRDDGNTEVYHMSLRWTDGIDFNSQLVIQKGSTRYSYDLINFVPGKPTILRLYWCEKTNEVTGNVFCKELYDYFYRVTISNKEYSLEIVIYPKEDEESDAYNMPLDLENYLMNIKLPIPVAEVYEMVTSFSSIKYGKMRLNLRKGNILIDSFSTCFESRDEANGNMVLARSYCSE